MLETIKIVSGTELGYMIINLDDYDESVHKIHGEKSPIEVEVNVKKTRSRKLSVDA